MTIPVIPDLLTAPVIEVNGTELTATQLERLIGVRITTALRLPGRAVLRFDDWEFGLSSGSTFAPGARVEISVKEAGVLFNGLVTGFDIEADRDVLAFTVVVDDDAHRLTQQVKVRTFTEVSYSDVVSKIAREAGLKVTADSTTGQFKYLIQSTTDYDFLCEIADRIGFDWWVHDRTLYFSAPTDTAPVARFTYGEDLAQFSVRATSLHPGAASVTGWDPLQKAPVTGTDTLRTSGTGSALLDSFLQAGSDAAPTATDTPLSSDEATLLAKRRVSSWKSGSITAKATCLAVVPAVRPGCWVELAGAEPVAGKYAVTEVEHVYSSAGFRTRFTAGERRPTSLVDRLAADQVSNFRSDGLIIGVVTGIGNPDGSPSEVKLKFPGIDAQLESAWARLAVPGGGKARGMLFVPEINDEVVVGFEGGDLRRPVVLGGLFNGKDSAPVFKKQGGGVDTRVITSRLGHTVEFGDGSSEDDQYIGLSLAGGHHQVKLGKKELTATVPSGIPIKLSAGRSSVEIGDDGSITLSGSKITLKAEQQVEISGMEVTAKANTKLALGGAMVEVKANAQAEVSSSGPVMIKGAMVMVN